MSPTLALWTSRVLLSPKPCWPLGWESTSASPSWGPPWRRREACSATRRPAPPCSSASDLPTWGTAGPGPNSIWPRLMPLEAVLRVLFSSTLTGLMPRALQGTSKKRGISRRKYQMFWISLFWKMCPVSQLGQYWVLHFEEKMRSPSLCESMIHPRKYWLVFRILDSGETWQIKAKDLSRSSFPDHNVMATLSRPTLY